MAVTLSSIKCVQLDDLKAVAKFGTDDQLEGSDGSTFIRLNPRNTSLVALIIEKNDHPTIPQPPPKNFSLTTSEGIAMLKRMRNSAQAESLTEDRPTACTLFASPDGAEKKKARITRSDMLQMRKEHVPIIIDVSGVSVRVLRPVQQDDILSVEYEEASIGAVMEYIRESGCTEDRPQRPRDPLLPPGIFARGGVFIVLYKGADGRKKHLRKKTLDEAVEAQAALIAEGTDCVHDDMAEEQ